MKKLLLIVFLLVFLCGCTDNEDSPNRNNRKDPSSGRNISTATPEPTPTPTEKPKMGVTKRPEPTATSTPAPTNTPTPIPYVATEEILAADVFSGKVQIMDTVLTFPCRLSEIMQLGSGLELSLNSSQDGYDPLNDTYGAGSRNTIELIFADGSEARIEVKNPSLESLPLGKLYVTELVSESPCIFFPKGVSVGSHCAVLKEWGEHSKLAPGSYSASYFYYEAEYVNDYGKRQLGVEFDIEVNNTTYNIDEVNYKPSFYVNMQQLTERVENNYPSDLKFGIPIAMNDGWRTGLMEHDGRYFVVEYGSSYLYDNPSTPEGLLDKLGRDMQYFNTEWENWSYYLDTSEETNEKVIVKEGETLSTVINYWDYSDALGEDGVTVDGKQLFPREDAWKAHAEVGVMHGGYIDLWEFSIGAIDKGEIPEEVMKVFRQVVQHMAESMVECEE